LTLIILRVADLAAALPEGLFEHPVGSSDSISDHARLCVFWGSKQFFNSLLETRRGF
jgi:hypothetical protein